MNKFLSWLWVSINKLLLWLFERKCRSIERIIIIGVIFFTFSLPVFWLFPSNHFIYIFNIHALRLYVASLTLFFPYNLARDVLIDKIPLKKSLKSFLSKNDNDPVQVTRIISYFLGIPLLATLSFIGIGLSWRSFILPIIVYIGFILTQKIRK